VNLNTIANAAATIIAGFLFIPLLLIGIPALKLWLWLARLFDQGRNG
jgi:hypothetical protein